MTSALFVRLAAALLPRELQKRYRREWNAELRVVREHAGRSAGIGFASSLVPAAVRTTLDVQTKDESAYTELIVAALCGLPPVIFLLGFGVVQGVWQLALAEAVGLMGILLVAYGLWRNHGRLDSLVPRLGLVLTLIGASFGIFLVEQLPELAAINPDEVIRSEIPNASIPVGFLLLVIANARGRRRRGLHFLSLLVLAPGCAAAVIVAIINAANSSGTSVVLSLLYGVPIVGLAWASYAIAGRTGAPEQGQTLAEL